MCLKGTLRLVGLIIKGLNLLEVLELEEEEKNEMDEEDEVQEYPITPHKTRREFSHSFFFHK